MTDDTLRDLGKQLPHDRPELDRRERVRASLLAAASAPAQPHPRRWLLVGGGFAAGALAAAAIAVVLVRPRAETTTLSAGAAHEAYAQIESSSAAELEHALVPTPSGTDEIVRVRTGKLRLAVPPTRAGDRVRVATGDAEIEGSGEYDLEVAADTLASLTVTAGTATIKLAAQAQPVFLAAGQTWRAKVQTADLTLPPPPLPAITATPSAPALATAAPATVTSSGSPIETSLVPASAAAGVPVPVPASTPRAVTPRVATTASPRPATPSGAPVETELGPSTTTTQATAPRAAVTAPVEDNLTTNAPSPATPSTAAQGSEVERHFRAGWSLLRAGKLADAIAELGAAADAGEGPLAADARYYQAVALVKAKRGAEAERALVQFLDRAPASIRRGRAAMMLGRLLADRGDAANARLWFEVAARDADASVATAARAALAAH